MKNLLALSVLTILTIIAPLRATAQESLLLDDMNNRKALGVNVMVGMPIYALPEKVKYSPVLFMGHYRFPIQESKGGLSLSLDVIPHYGVVFLGDQSVEHEVGINCWLDISMQLNSNASLSLDIGTGPHFITIDTERQARGFAFSDNLFVIYKLWPGGTNKEVKAFLGFRHVSNASLMRPNGGIDNLVFGIGGSGLF